MSKIVISNLYKSFGTQRVLNGIDLVCENGETTIIIGGSGAGKSLLLKLIIGLERPESGEIIIDGENITKLDKSRLLRKRMNFGYLFQDAALFDYMNVYENISFPLIEHTRLKEDEIRLKVSEKLALVGLSNIEHKMPNELSGGMRKRVGLARAIVLDPKVILYDEPTTGLDPIMTEAINNLIANTKERLKITSIVISHDIRSSFRIADKIAMLDGGRIVEYGPPASILASKNEGVRLFLQDIIPHGGDKK